MPVPDYQSFMRPVLEEFAAHPGSIAGILPKLKLRLALSDEDAEETLPSGKQTLLSNRAHWARVYLSKAGCLESPKRNQHVITQRGKDLLARHSGPITNDVLSRFDGFEAWKQGAPDDSSSAHPVEITSQDTPEQAMAQISAEVDAALTQDLLNAVLELTPTRFEQLIVDLLIAMGYGGGDQTMGQKIGKSGDGGIDGVINEDALGLDAVYIQAKRYAIENKVGRPALQAFVGSLTGEVASKGVFVTTSDFSAEAKAYVEKVQHRIVLINGKRLASLMIQHEVGVRTRAVYRIRSVDEDYFSNV